MRLYARNMSHDRNRHAGMLSPSPACAPHPFRQRRLGPDVAFHMSARELARGGRSRTPGCRPRPRSALPSACQPRHLPDAFLPCREELPPSPQTANGTARRADPQRSPPANTRHARHRRARHRRARRRRARHLACASRTRGRRREQSGMRRRPRASGRPRQCVRPDSR